MLKMPSPLVVADFSTPFAETAVTVAPTITPPNSSTTCPLRAESCWPRAMPAQSARIISARPIRINLNDSFSKEVGDLAASQDLDEAQRILVTFLLMK